MTGAGEPTVLQREGSFTAYYGSRLLGFDLRRSVMSGSVPQGAAALRSWVGVSNKTAGSCRRGYRGPQCE
jgi:hypothetical protein